MFKILCCLMLCWVSTGLAEVMDLGTIIVTPNRFIEEIDSSTSNISIINQQTIAKSHAQTVADLLKQEAGVQLIDNSSAKTQVVDIRGMGDTAGRNVLVLVNGRRVNPVDNSGPDFMQVPVDSVERIEVIRGAGSVLYGDNAVGGVINIITKKGKDGLHAALSTSYDSNDSWRTTQEFSGAKGKFDYYINTSQFDTDGYRANSHLRSRDYVGRFGFKPSAVISFDLNTNWHEDDYGLPGGIKDVNLAQLGRRGTVNPEDFAKTKDRMVQLTADLNPWVEDNWGHFVNDISIRNRDTYAVFYSFGEYATKRNINSVGVNSRYVLKRDINEHGLDLVAGVDYYSDDNAIYGSAGNSDNLNITKNALGLYINSSYEVVKKLFIDAGTRFEKAYYTFNQMSAPKSYQDQSPDKQIAMGGLRYEYAPGSNVFVNAQQTFRFLTTDDWYDTFNGLNTSLNQQKGVQYQAGIKHRFDDKADVSITPYLINNRNEIFLDPAGGGGFGATSNYDRTRRYGVEFGQDFHLKNIFDLQGLDRLDWYTQYTYQRAQFPRGVYKGNDIPMAPNHVITTGVTIGFLKHFDYDISARFIGRQYAINDIGNVLPKTDPYAVVDNQITYHRDNWEVFGGIDNLFGERYDIYVTKAITSNIKSHFPAPERTFKAGAKIKF